MKKVYNDKKGMYKADRAEKALRLAVVSAGGAENYLSAEKSRKTERLNKARTRRQEYED